MQTFLTQGREELIYGWRLKIYDWRFTNNSLAPLVEHKSTCWERRKWGEIYTFFLSVLTHDLVLPSMTGNTSFISLWKHHPHLSSVSLSPWRGKGRNATRVKQDYMLIQARLPYSCIDIDKHFLVASWRFCWHDWLNYMRWQEAKGWQRPSNS